ncbi:mitochondrial biogenesis AIM24-domain-containing protein [Entophlyctis helioformis]|nr:mitochondrial biogenesis AIM24-domain-containing protein [Entophlyctis helioformis]
MLSTRSALLGARARASASALTAAAAATAPASVAGCILHSAGTRRLLATVSISTATDRPPLPPSPVVRGVASIDPASGRDFTAGLYSLAEADDARSTPAATAVATPAALVQASPAGTAFEVVNSGPGSVLVAHLAAHDAVSAVVGTLVGASGPVSSHLSLAGSLADAAKRRLAGGSLFFEKFTTAETTGPTRVIVAPKRLGDVAAVAMDGSVEYTVRQSALLAASAGVQVSPAAGGFGLLDNGFFNYRVHGKGAVALTAYAGLVRLVLRPGEECVVTPRHIVAWDASMLVEPVVSDALPQAKIPLKPTIAWLAQTNLPSFVKNAAEATIQSINHGVQVVAHQVRYWIIGQRGMYCLRGPGDVYLASRIPPAAITLPSFGRGESQPADKATATATP